MKSLYSVLPKHLRDKISETDGHRDILGIALDSRKVQSGFLFAALPGTQTNGSQFIKDAVSNGAIAILAPSGATEPSNIVMIPSPNAQQDLASICAQFYEKQPGTITAVTGTNGKSSTVEFLRQIWVASGLKAASLGTLGSAGSTAFSQATHTTPDPIALHHALHQMSIEGITHLAMEASSHGLLQRRMDGVSPKIALFTNLTQDHLDYHKDFNDYRSAKARLFSELVERDGTVILNADSADSVAMRDAAKKRTNAILSYGWKGEFIRLGELSPRANGQHMSLTVQNQEYEIFLPLIGEFQAHNAMAAAAAALVSGIELDVVMKALQNLTGVAGRLEFVGRTPKGSNVYVDFAHTPDGLETVLRAIRPHTPDKLHILFGAGGDRDPYKRKKMGAAAQKLADIIYVTDDNPRSEDPQSIRTQVMEGCPKATEIGDRAKAIEVAIKALGDNDLLIIAGKGHESGQTIGNETIPFDDRLVSKDIVDKLHANDRSAFA